MGLEGFGNLEPLKRSGHMGLNLEPTTAFLGRLYLLLVIKA